MSTDSLAQNIKKERKKLGWSMDRLSKEANIPFSTLNKLEIGAIKNPTLDTLVKIADAFKTSIDYLIGR